MLSPTRPLNTRPTNARRCRRRRPASNLAACLVGLFTLTLTACGSSSTPNAAAPTTTGLHTPAFSPSNSTPAITSSSATDSTAGGQADGLTYLGTFTNSSPGSSVTTKVSIGQPVPNTQGQPPTDVLSACNWNYGTSIAQSVYIHGSLTISYTGSIAESVIISEPTLLNLLNQLKTGGGLGGSIGIQGPDGAWNGCTNGSVSWSYVLQPNSTVTADMWIDDFVLSNSHPTFTTADQEPLAITFAAGAVDPNSSATSTTTVSGPHAATCTSDGDNPTPTMLLFSTPPYLIHSTDETGITHTGSCTAT